MKYCAGCNADRDDSLFGRDASKEDGMTHKCRACNAAYQKARRVAAAASMPVSWKKKTANMAEYMKEWKKANPGYVTQKKKEWYAKNRDRLRVREAVKYALKSGKLVKTACHVCGKDNVEGHHPDYSRPLDVVWLCREHHLQIHSA